MGYLFYFIIYPMILFAKARGKLDIDWWLVLAPLWFPVVLAIASLFSMAFLFLMIEFSA